MKTLYILWRAIYEMYQVRAETSFISRHSLLVVVSSIICWATVSAVRYEIQLDPGVQGAVLLFGLLAVGIPAFVFVRSALFASLSLTNAKLDPEFAKNMRQVYSWVLERVPKLRGALWLICIGTSGLYFLGYMHNWYAVLATALWVVMAHLLKAPTGSGLFHV